MQSESTLTEQKYLKLILDKIEVCRAYKPKFGQGKSVSLDEFRTIYGADAFYSWFGLDNPLMYAAHKAAGGITSLYRQIGIGCEQLFRQIIRDHLGLSVEEAAWSYVVAGAKDKTRVLRLDGRIELDDLRDDEHRARVETWLRSAAMHMDVSPEVAAVLKGVVFEVRQGYKSKDSKRQNADIGNAGAAYKQGYLPVVVVLSTQIDGDVADRYAGAGWLLLRGYAGGSALTSTYEFCRQVIGYDLADFLTRHADDLKASVDRVLGSLLSADDAPVGETTSALPGGVDADEIELAEELEGDGENAS